MFAMIAWMAARCDEPNYGQLIVYNFPKQRLVYGPTQIVSRINQEAEISKQLTLWSTGGSTVIRGSPLVIPVEQSILYIQPLYLAATQESLPELKRIIVAYGNTIAMEETLELSLSRIFGGMYPVCHVANGNLWLGPTRKQASEQTATHDTMAGDKGRMPLLTAVEQVNERQKGLLFDKVKSHFGDDLSRLTFAIWGLAFKPRTDDMRDAPAIVVIKALLDAGSRVQAFDPEAMEEARKIFGDRIQYTHRNYDALHGAAALLILTEWNEFRRPDFLRIKDLLKQPVIFDGRNIFDPADLRKLGFTYYSIGRNDG